MLGQYSQAGRSVSGGRGEGVAGPRAREHENTKPTMQCTSLVLMWASPFSLAIGLVAWVGWRITSFLVLQLYFSSFFLLWSLTSFFSPLVHVLLLIVPFPWYSFGQTLVMEAQHHGCEWGSGTWWTVFESGLYHFLVVRPTQTSDLTLCAFIVSSLQWIWYH